MPKIDPCKAYACNIQQCLKDNSYQEKACVKAIEEMRKCCEKWGTKSYVCGGIKTDQLRNEEAST